MKPTKGKPSRKLMLNKETLAKLDEASLGKVVGGNNSLPPACRLTPRICTP